MKHEEDLNTAKTICYRDRASDSAAGYDLPSAGFEKYDYGHGSVLFMMYVAGLSYKVIAVVLVSGSALVLALLLVITQVNFQIAGSSQKDSIMSWMYPVSEILQR